MDGLESVASSLAASPVPLDGSPLAESFVSQLDVAVPGTVALELIRVVIPPMITPALTGASPHSVAGVLEEQLGLAGQYVEAIAARLQQNGCAVRTAVVADLSPASAIAAHAHEHRCDAIAIATRGRGGIDRLLLGSVADKVIRAAEVPVLVWNPPSGAATRVIDAKEAMMNDDDVRAVAAYVWSITHPPRIPPAVQRA